MCYRYTTSHHYIKRTEILFFIKWGGRWDSNPRHLEPQSSALPTELHPPFIYIKRTMIICAACLLATGTPRGIRTPGLLLRRQLLYPAELLTQNTQRGRRDLERVMGIEPTLPAWKAGILPLNYTRSFPHNVLTPTTAPKQALPAYSNTDCLKLSTIIFKILRHIFFWR